MSYEGRVQAICKNGHYCEIDCYMEEVCHCKEPFVWSNQVDDTNGDAYGFIPEAIMNQFILTPVESQACNMGHTHIIKEAIYKIPTDTKELRHYWDDQKGMFIPVAMLRE